MRFASPVNGDRLMLTPEESMRIQRVLGADVVMVFDECTPYPSERARDRGVDAPVAALGGALEARPRGQRQRAVRHRAGRHVRGPARRIARGPRQASASTATPSAGSRWASPSASMRRIMRHTAPRLPADQPALPHGRGHARGHRRGGRGGHRHVRLRACRRATRATAGSSPASATSRSATPATATTRGRSTTAAPATPARISRAATCTICRR